MKHLYNFEDASYECLMKTQQNYREIASNKEKLIKQLQENPNFLFQKIQTYESRYVNYVDHVNDVDNYFGNHCDCMCCNEESLTVLDIVKQNKTLNEKDFLEIAGIDWYTLSGKMQLSNDILMKLQSSNVNLDWKEISESFIYLKDYDFFSKFHMYIHWEKCRDMGSSNFYITNKEAYDLTFTKQIIPFTHAVRLKMLDEDDIIANQHLLFDSLYENLFNMLRYFSYGAKVVDRLEDNDDKTIEKTLESTSDIHKKFFDSCLDKRFLPRRYARVLINGIMKYNTCTWRDFFEKCQPDENYIEEHVISREGILVLLGMYSKVIDLISGRDGIYKVCLSNTFIEKYKESLNWKYLFRNHKFDEDTIRHRICSETVSEVCRYATLTPSFIEELSKRCDEFELDWYELCEHQNLPEWLMRKYVDKLNWGQVSSYQSISKKFYDDYKHMLNEEKLKKNMFLFSFRI